MQYLSQNLQLGALFMLSCVVGCLAEFPDYVGLDSTVISMDLDDAGPQPDQGQMCGASSEIVIGMSCEMVGGQQCGLYACVNQIPVCVETPSDGSAVEAPLEACNGRDDDCDGITDEGFEMLGVSCKMEGLVNGQPVLGEWICNPIHSDAPGSEPYICDCCLESEPNCSRPCQPTCNATGNELCNNTDDDCDGVVDEDLELPCDYQLDGCSVMGKAACVSGAMTACTPPLALPLNCRCIDAAFGGGTHYIHCPDLVSATRGEAICAQVRSGTTSGGVSFPSGRLLDIESRVEHTFISTELYAEAGGVKTWLNHSYDPDSDPNDFEDWLVQYFPFGTYHAVSDDDFEDDERRCLSMENNQPHEWGFDPCESVTSGLTCEFCADENQDGDGDGRTACAGDCDDSNPDVYWGAQELCHNGIDENCDGQKDEECPCEARVYDGHQYLFCNDQNADSKLAWEDARTQCRDWGMNLLVLDTQSEFLQLAVMAGQIRDGQQWWIGVRQPTQGENNEDEEVDRNRVWRWVETGVLDDPESAWWQDNNREQHDRPDRDCGRLFTRGDNDRHVRADNCWALKAYICESLP